MAHTSHVTLVITHTLLPGQAERYEQWLGKIMPIAAEFPGHLGANVIRPTDGQHLWTVIIRFDTLEHLSAWTQSDTRNALVKRLNRCWRKAIKPKCVPRRRSGLPHRSLTCVSLNSGNSFSLPCWLSSPVPTWYRWSPVRCFLA